MKPSPAGEVLIRHDAVKKMIAAQFIPPKDMDGIVVECRQLYEISKILYHDGRISFEHLEKIRVALEKVEAKHERWKAANR